MTQMRSFPCIGDGDCANILGGYIDFYKSSLGTIFKIDRTVLLLLWLNTYRFTHILGFPSLSLEQWYNCQMRVALPLNNMGKCVSLMCSIVIACAHNFAINCFVVAIHNKINYNKFVFTGDNNNPNPAYRRQNFYLTSIKTWESNCLHDFVCNVICYPYWNFSGDLTKPPLKLGHRCVITSYRFTWI